MNAIYRLSEYPACFNFIEFLVAACTLGATHVRLDNTKGVRSKYDAAETDKRMKSIVEPACALAGRGFSYGAGEGIDPGYHISAALKAWKKAGRIERLRSVKPAASVPYTVTLRNSRRFPERNSDQAAWRAFALAIGATVIEDYDDKPTDLHDRMALYAGATMNYGVGNGPMALLWFSEYPFCTVMKNVRCEYLKRCGWPCGTNLPWQLPNQHFHWGTDDAATLRSLPRA